jgi:uncharacterized protein (DUF2147 family)
MRKAVFAILTLLAVPASAAAPVSGRWFTAEKDSIVEIAPCGPALCGKIVRILKPTPDGKPAIDRNNPNPALRSRPILGLTLLSGFRDGGDQWDGGTIYDPRAGKSYKAKLKRLANGNLQVTGCVSVFCRSVIFTPVS